MSYSLFPKSGSIGTPDNPKVEVPGRVRNVTTPKVSIAKVAKKELKKHPGLNRIDKFLDKRMTDRPVVKKTNIKVSLSKLGVY